MIIADSCYSFNCYSLLFDWITSSLWVEFSKPIIV